MRSSDIIRVLEADGWVLVRVTGSHHQFHHPTKGGTVTVQHPRRDVPVGTQKSIERQSGVKLR
jgi:predicted RNA binding protein YcfA (HicA-like mRNA interferase family)